ncbi:hypothetical protein M3O96_09245 [Aquiflexum sp. TKW24L]|uniref:hypothetical protein n=1 Tax=Aquiflexum sp. TKW24L TaxID=2942212 RepID=UPI0020C12759|nr:hypothetical protein [Aquiflexum sp. TKW24L]MCL6259271.1 hypothetical protein [Aquiflexum sp. TKW24L]
MLTFSTDILSLKGQQNHRTLFGSVAGTEFDFVDHLPLTTHGSSTAFGLQSMIYMANDKKHKTLI